MPGFIYDELACPPCLDLVRGTKKRHKCDRHRPTCSPCLTRGEGDHCAKMRVLRELQGPNFITEDLFGDSEKSSVIELGKINVDIMNKFPGPLNIATNWEQTNLTGRSVAVSICTPVRRFIDVTSLLHWKRMSAPNVDLDALGFTYNGEFKTAWQQMFYGGPMNVQKFKCSIEVQVASCYWVTKSSPTRKSKLYGWQRVAVVVKRGEVLPEKLDPNFDPTGYGIFDTGDLGEGWECTLQASQEILLRITGMIGSVDALQRVIQTQSRSYSSSPWTSYISQRGSWNYTHIWQKPRADKGNYVIISVTQQVRDNLVANYDFKRSSAWLRTTVRDQACIAYIMQQSLVALAEKKNLLHVLFAAFVTAEYFERGLLTRDDALAGYCLCENAQQQAMTEHYCVSCLTVSPCNQMSLWDSGNGFLLICNSCFGHGYSDATIRDVRSFRFSVRTALVNNFRHDSKTRDPTWTVSEMTDLLIKEHACQSDPHTWRDGYSETLVTPADTKYAPELGIDLRIANMHPFKMSIEKPHARSIRKNGIIHLHGLNNVTLTKDCINRCKGNFPPSILPWVKRALQLKLQVDLLPPCRGYHPEVSEQWETIEAVCY